MVRLARSRSLKRIGLSALSLGVVVATFAYFLPTIADYGDVWDTVKDLSWQWLVALAVTAAVSLATFAPPWMVALPGLSFGRAFEVTQISTALSIVVPGGAAAGFASSFALLRSWGVPSWQITRAVTLTGLWNQFMNLSFPIVGVFLLSISGGRTAGVATAAFIGVAILGVLVTGFVLVLISDRLAEDVGDVAARFANWALGKIRRGPVSWSGKNFERFRHEAGTLVTRRWHLLTLTALAGSLTTFLTLYVSLRALGVSSDEVTGEEAFAAWAFVRLLGTIPITPGGFGVVELALTGTLVGFGGQNAEVVAAVLVYRFLTVMPPIAAGLIAAFTSRGHRKAALATPAPEDVTVAPLDDGAV
ncbi:MAG TPA: lysylphosphatidylglycerol synthase transmembrane domain-containing protein [Gaiellaceae bacterium]|jgi:uncharacterized protein (TIRG00374 family)